MTKSLAALYWFKINERRRHGPEAPFPHEDTLLSPDAENGYLPDLPLKPPSLWRRLWRKLWTSPPA